ncbi:DUF397 domain-containing protein [Streptomyces sp. Ac-502]|uniref:DUF397 domain-containing protein n=1 Tax=Streptomyces sp. Ac-502 TaxID=3342801 RepID=UPI0038621F24
MKIGAACWAKSSYSSPEGGNCLEWDSTSGIATGAVAVRDSKNPGGPVLSLSSRSFAAFIAGVKAGTFTI